MSLVSLNNNMGAAGTKEMRFSCSECNLIFSSQRDFQLHADELHGELGRCLKAGCGYSGSTSAGQIEVGKERAEKVISASNSENIVSSAEGLKGNVVADHDSGKVSKPSLTSSNSSEPHSNIIPSAEVRLYFRSNEGQQEYGVEEQLRVRAYIPLPPGASGPRSLGGTHFGGGFGTADGR